MKRRCPRENPETPRAPQAPACLQTQLRTLARSRESPQETERSFVSLLENVPGPRRPPLGEMTRIAGHTPPALRRGQASDRTAPFLKGPKDGLKIATRAHEIDEQLADLFPRVDRRWRWGQSRNAYRVTHDSLLVFVNEQLPPDDPWRSSQTWAARGRPSSA